MLYSCLLFALACWQPLPARVSLRELAGDRLQIGAAVDPALLKEPEYAATLAREFNQVEPETP
jgi:hypothetical protein